MSKNNGQEVAPLGSVRGKKLTPWKVPSTGVMIQTVPVSFIAVTDAMRREPAWREPEPPLVEVELMGEKTVERNYADPDFPKMLDAWTDRFNQEAARRVLYRIALAQQLTDEQKSEVAELREVLGSEGLHRSDKVVWLFECAIGKDTDFQRLIQFVTGQADPQPEAIEKKAEAGA